jgi:photosystem II stability/assembly factor-like uncharacterized protein
MTLFNQPSRLNRAVGLILGTMAATAVCLGSTASPSGGGARQKIHYVGKWDRQKSGVSDDLRAVFFLDARNGWAAGAANTILHTSDGGLTWVRLLDRDPAGQPFDSVMFASLTEGWASTADNLLHTTDGGKTWQPSSKLPTQVSNGFSGGGAVVGSTRFQLGPSHFSSNLYRSTDGGQNWTEAGDLVTNTYSAVCFVDSTHGWVLRDGTDETLRITQDGGQTWTPVSRPHAPHAAKMRFVNANLGWMVGQDGSAMMATADGGKTWKSQYTGQASWVNLLDLSVPDDRHGYVVTDNGVLGTATGGSAWRSMLTGVTGLTAISFPDTAHGWVVGKGGYVNHYHIVAVPEK